MSMEYIIFDGVDSRNYGVYVHGDHAYDRPARRAERVTVQGRHGLLTTSEDCFEESVVTYPVAIVGGFKANIDAWLNALASRRGRHRLADSFNTDVYRMASFLDAVEADPSAGGVAGQFEVTFQCLPQRFLIDGENVLTYPPGIANSKNLLTYPYYQTTRTSNGVTWTDNGDGTITADGTATSGTSFRCVQATSFNLPAGEYVLSGCPTGGNIGGAKYRICAQYSGLEKNDWGDGVAITLDEATDVGVYCYVYNGTTVNNITFRPMIRLASETDPDWVPYYDGATQIYNPTLFESQPLIRVHGAGTVGIGGVEVTVASNSYEYIDIDCDIMDCFHGTDNCNGLVSFSGNDFPTLPSGVTAISLDGVTKVEITPRWWMV